MSLTGNKDTDYEILMLLDDKELGIVCQSNKKVNRMCEDPNFWIAKIIKKFKIDSETFSYLNHFLEFKTYKKLYKYLINVDTVEEKIQFISLGGRYDIDKLNKNRDKAVYPKYIDKNLFFIDLKRKIFEQTIDGDEFLIFHDENIQEIYETEMKNLVESIINEDE